MIKEVGKSSLPLALPVQPLYGVNVMSGMNTPRERQLYMVQLIKTIDRLVAERAGHAGAVLVHYQRPQLGPGDRDAVCVHHAGGRREFLPYGPELEAMVDDARRWVRQGVGPVPLPWRLKEGGVVLAAKGAPGAVCVPVVAQAERTRGVR